MLIAGIGLLVSLSAACTASPRPTPGPEAIAELARWWSQYRQSFLLPEGRVIRPRDGGDTVSEGQAYALIAAALLDDRQTFDLVFSWTESNLSRQRHFGDRLLAWHWREGAVTDWNSSSDADLDYCMALLMAHERWGDETYRATALAVASDVLEKEVFPTRLGPLLAPGTWGSNADGSLMVNPSYLSPATFRMLARETGDRRWNRLAASAYALWRRSGQRLGRMRGVGLPPDWCVVMPDGEIAPPANRVPAFGWEALRVPMRAGMDALIHDSAEARAFLRRNVVRFFRNDLSGPGDLPAAVYAYWGGRADPSESLAMTAMVLFAFQAAGAPPPPHIEAAFDRQRRAPALLDDYYAQSLVFYPLAFRAGVIGR